MFTDMAFKALYVGSRNTYLNKVFCKKTIIIFKMNLPVLAKYKSLQTSFRVLRSEGSYNV